MVTQSPLSRGKQILSGAVVVSAIALSAGFMSGTFTASAQDATGLTIGQAVVVSTDALNLRNDASSTSDVLTILPQATYATVLDGPIAGDDYSWYLIEVDGTSGYVASGFLVDHLLLLARMDQQRGLEARPLDLVSLASAAAADFETVTQDHPLDWDPDEEIMIRGDRIRLRQIIDNLLSNARTHTPSGTTIRMAVRRDGTEAELTIADNGPGIKAEDRERVFERFWRADSSRQRNTGGTGLGLAIVQSLVLAHGGTVKLVSEPGAGAEFTIRLPIAV